MTVAVWPFTVTVAERLVVVVFVVAFNATVPEPVPVAPETTVNHDLLLVAVQVHPAFVLTVTFNAPPDADADCEVGVSA